MFPGIVVLWELFQTPGPYHHRISFISTASVLTRLSPWTCPNFLQVSGGIRPILRILVV
ncbi:hypothetical protein PAXRUDRAFT_770520 [Paxillus rubicundulus Ve08.2h10]|uniref:Uncharacterized protein n=1 Tax=Paxillus rubicundulus Ve08.2h10 TaxID=930991 RepID=A0A0D0DSR0_9AGAM|nr:hypothetical protein PAXRUDRAFT_770520 [Paxillus rubicundulus Ve08.2h10]